MKTILKSFIILLVMISSFNPVQAQPLSNEGFAIVNLEKQVREHPRDKGAYMALLLLYSQNQQDQKFLDTMHTVIKKFKKDDSLIGPFNEYARDYMKQGKLDLAAQISSIALKNYKDDSDMALIRSEILLKQGKYKENISFLSDYLKRNSAQYFLHDRLIYSYLMNEEYQKAFDAARRAQQENISNIHYYFLEALALQMIDKDKAIQYYKAYLDKLQVASDLPQRIKVAQKIYQTLTNKSATQTDYTELVKFTKEQNAPDAIIEIQKRYAAKH
jgi:tetratricopeptide (TPR) repeat protein